MRTWTLWAITQSLKMNKERCCQFSYCWLQVFKPLKFTQRWLIYLLNLCSTLDLWECTLLIRARIQSPGAGLSGCRSRCGPARNGRCGHIQPWPEWPGRSPPSPGSHSCLAAGCHCSRWGMYLHFKEMWKKVSVCNFWLLFNANIEQRHIFFCQSGEITDTTYTVKASVSYAA